MRYAIRPVVEADMADFTRVGCDAITDPKQGNPGGEYIRACWPRMNTQAGRANAQLRFTKMLQSMPPGSLTKAVDTDADDKLVGIAIWTLHTDPPKGYPPLELGDFWESKEEEDYGKFTWHEVMSEYLRHYESMKVPFMALEILAVDPKCSRGCIGTLLTQEGLARADKMKAPVFVNSTKPAVKLYLNQGFEILDGQPQAFERTGKYADRGGTGSCCMIRPKQASAGEDPSCGMNKS